VLHLAVIESRKLIAHSSAHFEDSFSSWLHSAHTLANKGRSQGD
jgi:hypothetical protein